MRKRTNLTDGQKTGGSATGPIREILRHLDDASRLRRNPIVATLVDTRDSSECDARTVIRRVRGLIAIALESIAPSPQDHSRAADYARRLYTIIERCDLRGELHAAVASDLGICRRQFYLDRRAALLRLADAMRAELEAPPQSIVPVAGDDVRTQLNLVQRLLNVGHFAGARSALEGLAKQELPLAYRAQVAHQLICLLCETRSNSEAQSVFGRAKRELTTAETSRDEKLLIEAELLSAQGVLLLEKGELAPAIGTAQRGIALLSPALQSGLPRVRSLLVECHVLAAIAQCEAAAFEDSVRSVESAKRFSDTSTDPAVLAALHLYSCHTHYLLPWGLGKAFAENALALEVARRHGLTRHEATALYNFCRLYFLRGQTAEALQYGRRALFFFRVVASPLELALLLLNLARIEIAAGNGERALELLAEGKPHAATNVMTCASMAIAEAQALVASERFEDAGRLARHARSIFERCGVHRRAGTALCVEAEVYARLGKHRNAIEAIHGAVDALEGNATPYWLAQVYRTSAEITGNKRHAAYAADIGGVQRFNS